MNFDMKEIEKYANRFNPNRESELEYIAWDNSNSMQKVALDTMENELHKLYQYEEGSPVLTGIINLALLPITLFGGTHCGRRISGGISDGSGFEYGRTRKNITATNFIKIIDKYTREGDLSDRARNFVVRRQCKSLSSFASSSNNKEGIKSSKIALKLMKHYNIK